MEMFTDKTIVVRERAGNPLDTYFHCVCGPNMCFTIGDEQER